MHKGTIVLTPFPFTDLSQYKVRPCLILYISPKGEDCVVAFISSISKENGNFSVPVKSSPKNGVKVDSVIKVDKIATLQKKIIIGEIGILEASIMKVVDAKLKNLFQI